jgi:hypothetical protein
MTSNFSTNISNQMKIKNEGGDKISVHTDREEDLDYL